VYNFLFILDTFA